MDKINDIGTLVLVYRSWLSGEEFTQPASDLVECGTLIDPDSGEDMELIGWRLAEVSARAPTTHSSLTLPRSNG